MILDRLEKQQAIHPPSWMNSNTVYMTYMGSVAYGVSSDTSDADIYGFCIPPKDFLFPHLRGEILDFGRQKKRFGVWQEHHVQDPSDPKKVWDFQIFSIVKYFHLCMDCNPNMIDSLFTPRVSIIHSTQIAEMVREQRHLFLHKGAWHRFKGYAYSQLHKMNSKDPTGKRKELREKFGFDVKYAYHLVRLLDECEQILQFGDIDLQRNKEHLKAIRRGEVSEEEVRQWAADKEAQLEKLYHESTLPDRPDEPRIKALLEECLEHHYGTMGEALVNPDAASLALQEIEEILRKVRGKS